MSFVLAKLSSEAILLPGVPVLPVLDIDPQEHRVRVLRSAGQPRLGEGVPQLRQLVAVVDDRSLP